VFHKPIVIPNILLQKVKDCGFNPAKGEIQSGHIRDGKSECPGIAYPGVLVYEWPSGIRQAKEFGSLVESFPNGIIQRFSDDFHVQMAPYQNQLGMPPAHGKANKRELRCRLVDKMSQYMRLHMIDFN